MKQVRMITPAMVHITAKKRVAAYCRVSSNSADQLNSYAAQIRNYTKLIRSREDWDLVDIFADEGISGTAAENRPEFQRMIRMCEQNEIDIILCKSISRFARNVSEALAYIRRLKKLQVSVTFEKEGINTENDAGEALLSAFATLAQNESDSISQNTRYTIAKQMESGTFVDNNAPYGFRLENKQLVIYEPEAEIVRQIFTMYINGMSVRKIAQRLEDQNVPTKYGNKKWASVNVNYILRNERYIGDCKYRKNYCDTTVPFKEHINRGQAEMYYASNTHAPLIAPDTFKKVQELLDYRKKQFARNTGLNTYPLTSRIRCSECGSLYRRKIRNGVIKWVCSKHMDDSASCSSQYYSEEQIYNGIISIINNLRFGNEHILSDVISRLEYASNTYKRNNKTALELSRQVGELNAKLNMLDQLRSGGFLENGVYQSQVLEIQQQIRKCNAERQDTFDNAIQNMMKDVKHMQHLLDEIETPLEEFDEKIFETLVKHIEINRDSQMTVTFIGNLQFTEKI